MKNIILSTLLIFVGICFAQAQSNDQVNYQVKEKSSISAAEKAAMTDENIEKKVCGTSGKVCYYKTSTDAKTGEVKKEKVEWSEEKASFVAASCSKDSKKACAGKSQSGKKCCSKDKAAGKKCCSKGKKSGCSGAKSADAMKNEAKEDAKSLKATSI